MKTTKLIGGKEAFLEALEEAYSSSRNAIVYNPDSGFSNSCPVYYNHPNPFGAVCLRGGEAVIACNYCANTGRRFVNRSDYASIRRDIIDVLGL